MSCRRICRELLWLARFGELGPSSQPHLEHLATCRGCRDEVGFDRAMVEQLRTALAERIAHAAPSPTAWDRIRAKAEAPEPRPAARLLAWTNGLVSRLRFASAMAGTGLALLLALNTQIVAIGVPVTSDPGVDEVVTLEQVPRVPPAELSAGAASFGMATSGTPPDPESVLNAAAARHSIGTTGAPKPNVPTATATEIRVVFGVTQTPEPGRDHIVPIEKRPAVPPVEMAPGAPA